MKKLKDLLKESFVWERKFGEKLPTLADVQRKKNKGKLNGAGIEKTYKALMELEKDILKLEKIFKREKGGMTRDRARKMEKSIRTLKSAWNNLYADTQGS